MRGFWARVAGHAGGRASIGKTRTAQDWLPGVRRWALEPLWGSDYTDGVAEPTPRPHPGVSCAQIYNVLVGLHEEIV